MYMCIYTCISGDRVRGMLGRVTTVTASEASAFL